MLGVGVSVRDWPGPFSELGACHGSEFRERNRPFSEL